MPDDPAPPKPKFVLKPKVIAYTDSPESDAASPAFDIRAALQDNHRRQVAVEPTLDLSTPRRSRRRRDYWLCLILGDLGFGTLALLGRENPALFVFALAGFVIFTLGLTWVMWAVMSDY